MKLKWMPLVLLTAGWAANPAFAFTTADNASRAPVAVPQTPVASEAKAQDARRAAEAAASKPTTGRAQTDARPNAAAGKDKQ